MSNQPGSLGPPTGPPQPPFGQLTGPLFPEPLLTAEHGFNSLTFALSHTLPTRIGQARAIRTAAMGQLRQGAWR